MGFFDRIGRSWEFAKTSYAILWHNKQLLIFPILSGAALLAVLASFALPLWGTGTMQQWLQAAEEGSAPAWQQAGLWITLFAFYFVNYFIIVFFNSALVACTFKVTAGEVPTVGFGLTVASRRLPQIFGWALLSAVIGVGLKAIESANEKVGRIVASLLGMAWSAMTFFVVPVIVIEGLGPAGALKSSLRTLKQTWGEALVGNFSLGIFGFLVALPAILLCGLLVYLGFSSGSMALAIAAVVLGVALIALISAATSAADVIFRALLYQYATGGLLPAEVDTTQFDQAFTPKG